MRSSYCQGELLVAATRDRSLGCLQNGTQSRYANKRTGSNLFYLLFLPILQVCYDGQHMNAQDKEQTIREAILDMVAYFAVFGMPVSIERLNALLSVKASHLAVQAMAREMVEAGDLVRVNDDFGLPGVRYVDLHKAQAHREYLLGRARKLARVLAKMPFIKAVCVVNSVAIGNVHEDSDIDLLVVTTPGRVFVAKGLLWKTLGWAKLLETEEKKAGQFSLGMFLTTRGVTFERDIMHENDPHLIYWLMTAVPVYGARRWYEILQASPYVRLHAPNYLWPKGGRSIDRAGMKWMDSLDDRGYKIHLRHTSKQAKNLRSEAFVRVRPDVINLHALDESRAISEAWHKLRGTWVEPKKELKPLRTTDRRSGKAA